MSTKNVTVFTSPGCSSCRTAKEFLSEQGVDFKEKNIQDEGVMDELEKVASGAGTMPVIVVGDQVMQGFDQAKLEKALA